MLGLTLREEFRGKRLKGTAIELSNDTNTGAIAPSRVTCRQGANLDEVVNREDDADALDDGAELVLGEAG